MRDCPFDLLCRLTMNCWYQVQDKVELCPLFLKLNDRKEVEEELAKARQEWEFVQEHCRKEESNARSL